MGILDKIGLGKKKDEEQKKPERDLEVKEAEQKKEQPEPEKEAKPGPAKSRRGGPGTDQAYKVLVKPFLSEKATMLASAGKYMFAVAPDANKSEIKKSVESVYGVKVAKVNVAHLPGKERRYGRSVGRTPDWKRAIVTLKPGQKIPGFIETVS